MNKSILTLLFALAGVAFSQAQAAAPQTNLCRAELQQAHDAHDLNGIKALLDFNLTPQCVTKILLLRSDAHLSNALLLTVFKEATKNLQQNGSSSGSSGTTNLLSKGLTSKLLDFASEYGAITQTSSGQTSTVSGSLDGIPLAIESHSAGLVAECPLNIVSNSCIESGLLDILGRFSYSVAFNTAQATQVNATASGAPNGNAQLAKFNENGNAATVTQITGKFVIVPPRVKFTKLTDALQKLEKTSDLQQHADQFGKAARVLRGYQQDASNAWRQWRDATAQHLLDTQNGDLVQEWENSGNQLGATLKSGSGHPTDDDITQAALTFSAAYAGLGAAERQFFNSQLDKPILTFEYDENRPVSQPSNSVLRFIYSQQVAGWTLTGNGAFSFYDSTPSAAIPGAGRTRDWQLAAEGDHDLPSLGFLGKPTFTAAYYFQDQVSPSILDVKPAEPVPGITFVGLLSGATQVFAQKGNIHVGQIRVSFGKTGSGLRVPFSFTASNRTELLTSPTWRGQVGISYDFDALLPK